MAGNIDELLEMQKRLITEDKRRLGTVRDAEIQYENCDNQHQKNNNKQQSIIIEDKENQSSSLNCLPSSSNQSKNLPLIERLDLNSNEGALEENKQAFVDKLVNCENPFRSNEDKETNPCNKMLRYGEFSPNNPELRVNAAPYIGLGEYELRRNLYLQRQRGDYLAHLAQKNEPLLKDKNFPAVKARKSLVARAVQTEIKNIHCPLVQYDLAQLSSDEDLNSHLTQNSLLKHTAVNHNNLPSSSSTNYLPDQRLTSAQNALLLKSDMDKPKSILSKRRTGSPRERLVSDFSHSYTPGSTFLDGFSFQDHDEEMERERMKRENYQRELRMQIDEKRRLQSMREDQERREQELENKRLEQQLLRMQEEQAVEDQIRSRRDEQIRRHSEDLLRRKHELQSRNSYRKHTESETLGLSPSLRNSTNVASKTSTSYSHYSPPVARRNPYASTSAYSDPNPRYNSLNRYDNTPSSSSSSYQYRKDALNRMDSLLYDSPAHRRFNTFSRYESLSRIDSLKQQQDTLNNRLDSLNIHDSLSNAQRRHSATQQDLRRSPKLQRRSSSSRFDDTLPIPVLKAHSPVAKELKNSIPFNSSRHGSDAVRKLEDKWQIPAVQKNIMNHHVDPIRDGQGRSILTQLGAIRMQLQQEQLRMDESLRRGNYSQNKAVDFH